MRRALIVCLLLAAGCGNALRREAMTAEWRVSTDGSVFWTSEDGDWPVAQYPAGAHSFWDCALYQGQWRAVCVNGITKDGRFVPADQMPVTTAACWTDLPCP